MKIGRNYDLLDKVAKRIYPVTKGERSCKNERAMMERVRNRVKGRVEKHLYLSDGLVIRLK